MKNLIKICLIINIIFLSFTGLAQEHIDKKKILCKTWKLKKIIIDEQKVKNKLLNDHIRFDSNMNYLTYDSKDVNLISSKKGTWKINEDGKSVITDPDTDNPTSMKILTLKENLFVYELNFKLSQWQVYLKKE